MAKKFTKKINKSAKKFTKKVNRFEKKNPGATLGIKVGAVVASGIATKIVVQQEVKKQLEAAKNPAPAPEKKSFFGKLPFIGKKKKDVPTNPEPEKVEVAA